MKTFLPFCIVLTLLACGCGEKSDGKSQSTNSVSSGNPLTAPVDYLGALGQAKKSAEKTVDTVAINQAISMFESQEGRHPNDLNELVTKGYMRQIPQPPYGMKIVYDASTGTAKVVKQ